MALPLGADASTGPGTTLPAAVLVPWGQVHLGAWAHTGGGSWYPQAPPDRVGSSCPRPPPAGTYSVPRRSWTYPHPARFCWGTPHGVRDLCGRHNGEGLGVNRFQGGHIQAVLTLETPSHESPVAGMFPPFGFPGKLYNVGTGRDWFFEMSRTL